MVVSALKTVTVAKPSGPLEAESIIFPFIIPWEKDNMHKKEKHIAKNRYFFIAPQVG
jgi:hypothetical protein